MSIESLTYADLAGRLGTSREAARSLVRRLRLPRQTANDGTVRVNVDLTDIQYKPLPRRSQGGHRADLTPLKPKSSSYRLRSSSLKQKKHPLKRQQPDTGRISRVSGNAATS